IRHQRQLWNNLIAYARLHDLQAIKDITFEGRVVRAINPNKPSSGIGGPTSTKGSASTSNGKGNNNIDDNIYYIIVIILT
ncbi:MAG: hypothetical protein ACXWE7_13635, partial [Nitrososphaeraceae archaeon]